MTWRLWFPMACVAVNLASTLWLYKSARDWRELAYEGLDATRSCRKQYEQQVKDFTEDINDRSQTLHELSEAFCRERVTGCLQFERLTRNLDGGYSCRCRK